MEAGAIARRDPTTGRMADARASTDATTTATSTWTVADPGPLGLAAFALTTFVLSMYNAGILDVRGEAVVFGLAFAYGGLAPVFAVLLALLLLGEQPRLLQLFGLAAIVAGVVMM